MKECSLAAFGFQMYVLFQVLTAEPLDKAAAGGLMMIIWVLMRLKMAHGFAFCYRCKSLFSFPCEEPQRRVTQMVAQTHKPLLKNAHFHVPLERF